MRYTEAKRNAVAAARRDGYDHTLILEDGSYVIRRLSLCRASDVILGKAMVDWNLGCISISYQECSL